MPDIRQAPRCARSPFALAAAMALSLSAPAGAVESRFDFDAEGWTVTNAHDGVGSLPATWQTAGRIFTNDPFAWTAFAAPAPFLGDLSSFLGGSLSFDLQVAQLDAAAPNYFGAMLRSGSDRLVWFGGVPGVTDPRTYLVPLDAAAPGWRLNPSSLAGPATGSAVDSATFAAILSRVDGLFIDADWRGGADAVTLDNVVLAAAVPEPGAMALWMAGLLAMGSAWRRRARRAAIQAVRDGS